ncbi:MAG TPA: signal peptidase II [Dissulfurispiraceae bacterium]|nr:signal peptidase II [Dissulfurispiraceae bacterium]
MRKHPATFFLISLCILALDQLTKYFIKTHIGLFDVLRVTSFFNIVYVLNTGSAFGLFKGLGNSFFIIIALLALTLITVLIIKDGRNRLAFALILGGAAGNLTDRIIFGHVIDFLDFYAGGHHWPAFNIADSALTFGISLLLIKTVFEKNGVR